MAAVASHSPIVSAYQFSIEYALKSVRKAWMAALKIQPKENFVKLMFLFIWSAIETMQ